MIGSSSTRALARYQASLDDMTNDTQILSPERSLDRERVSLIRRSARILADTTIAPTTSSASSPSLAA
jgi:hypothetical protein